MCIIDTDSLGFKYLPFILNCHSLNFLIYKTDKIILSTSIRAGRMDEEMQPQAYVRSAQQILISLWRCFPLLQKSVEPLSFSDPY